MPQRTSTIKKGGFNPNRIRCDFWVIENNPQAMAYLKSASQYESGEVIAAHLYKILGVPVNSRAVMNWVRKFAPNRTLFIRPKAPYIQKRLMIERVKLLKQNGLSRQEIAKALDITLYKLTKLEKLYRMKD